MVENQQPRENNNVSEHYLNDKGQKYYQNIFIGLGEEMPGRVFQALAFSPYCNDSDVVVDFGCYDGLLVRNVSAAKRIGVDANSAARKACKKLDGISGIDVEFYSSLEELDSNIADVVFSNHCLEHVPNPLRALQQIKRILKLNGKLLLKVPFDDWRQAGH